MHLEKIQTLIYELRGEKVMLDFDIATIYEVETKVLNQAVKRNIERLPKDFMFQLNKKEWETMRSQIVTASSSVLKRNISQAPYAFTEHGVTMLASILRSEKAVKMNIAIIRAFIAMRKFTLNYKDIVTEIKELNTKVGVHDKKLNQLFEALEMLLEEKKIEKNFMKGKELDLK
jgi:phage regulator Rha-like protein